MEQSEGSARRKGVPILWVLVLMLASFAGGTFLGLNPGKIPSAIGLPAHTEGQGDAQNAEHLPATNPSTEPATPYDATQPSAATPQSPGPR